MRTLRILFLHELKSLAIAAPTYIASALFLALMGFLYWQALREATELPLDYTPVQGWFKWFPPALIVVVPLLTMRSFAEERRMGTLGALFSTPVHPVQVVYAKFAAIYVMYLVMCALALLFPCMAWWYLNDLYGDPRLLSLPSLLGGYSFVAVSGALYLAVGMLASSLTRSMLVAAMLTFCALFLVILFGWLLQQIPPGVDSWEARVQQYADYLHTYQHLGLFLRGIVDTRTIFLFGTGAMLALGLTSLTIQSKA
ncbi:MAG: ABC transporter permease subunit [Puniceicoccales bacterium]|jgi:ABC-2 type transport system permease protein|nr:ABC transporter permease subunit [Puniceicoccales bacterium]